tara:strand:+ start:4120 stop:5820 length:1701 start_codon:yes stop_codon:yes gene_type:complete
MIEWNKQPKSKQLLFVILSGYFLLGIHYFFPNPGGHGLYLPFNIIGWIFISLVIGAGFWRIYETGVIQLSQFFSYALLATLFLILPLFYRNNDLASWSHHRLLGLVGGVFFYFSLLQFKLSKKESHFFLYVILAGVVIESILGISQYYFLSQDNWMGYDTNQNFPYGVFQQKNMMGIFMVTGCAISLYLLKNDQEFSQLKIAYFLLLFMPFSSSILLIAIKSKSAFLSYFVFLCLAAIKFKIKQKRYQSWLLLSIIGFSIGLMSPKLIQRKFSERPIAAVMDSNNSRLVYYKNTLNLFLEEPFHGQGYGSFRSKYREIDASRLAKEPHSEIKESSKVMDHPHNEALLWAAEGGILPLFGLFIIAGSYLLMISRARVFKSLSYLSLIFPILLSSQVSLPFSLSLTHWITFLSILFITDMHIGKLLKLKFNLSSIALFPALAIPLITSNYMFGALQTAKTIIVYEETGLSNHDLLLATKMPGAWRMKHENYKLKVLYDQGMRTGDKQTLKLFLNESEKFLQFAPFIHLFRSMETVYRSLGEFEEADSIRKRAKYIYPTQYQKIYGMSK